MAPKSRGKRRIHHHQMTNRPRRWNFIPTPASTVSRIVGRTQLLSHQPVWMSAPDLIWVPISTEWKSVPDLICASICGVWMSEPNRFGCRPSIWIGRRISLCRFRRQNVLDVGARFESGTGFYSTDVGTCSESDVDFTWWISASDLEARTAAEEGGKQRKQIV